MTGNVKRFIDEIRIYDCGLTKIRIGNRGDGGYIVLREPCEKTGIVYSFGIGEDSSFEEDFLHKFPRVEIRMHDPHVDNIPLSHRRMSFIKQGIGLRYPALEDVAEGSLLKMDIEWDEWGTFLTMDEEELRRFGQIVAEFHIVFMEPRMEGYTPYFRHFFQTVAAKVNEDLFAMYDEAMARLNRTFWCCHIHANNSLQKTLMGKCWIPPLIELSFVRKDLVPDARVTDGSFPVEGLDYPNKSDRPDITNYYPLGR